MHFVLLSFVALAGASQAMRGHHHHHHHHHNGAPPSEASAGDAGGMDFIKNGHFDEAALRDQVAMSSDKTDVDVGNLPSGLQGLAKAANSGDEQNLMASIEQMAGSHADDGKDLHIKNEGDQGAVYDLRGVFKETQTVPPLTVTQAPPEIVMKQQRKHDAEKWRKTSTTTKTAKSTMTTTTITTTTTTTTPAKPAGQPAVQPVAQSLAQPVVQQAARPVQQPAVQPQVPPAQAVVQPVPSPVVQPAMPFSQQSQQFPQFPQQPQQFQQFPQPQQFQQFPQQNAFLPPQSQMQAPNPLQAIQSGLGVMMQSVGAAAAQQQMAQQQVQLAEQMDRGSLDQLTKRVATLEAGQNSAGHNSDADLKSKLQAETAQVQAQSTAVKDESIKTQEIMKRLQALEDMQKNKVKVEQNKKTVDIGLLRRLDELEKKVDSSERQRSKSNHTEAALASTIRKLKDVTSQLASFKKQLDATSSENAALRAEVQKLKAIRVPPPRPPPPPPSAKEDEDDDASDDASLLQFGHRHHEESIDTFFHRKMRHGNHKK